MEKSDKTLLVLGATSGVALAYLRLVCEQNRFDRYVLLARNGENLAKVTTDIGARSGKDVLEIVCDLSDVEAINGTLSSITSKGIEISECFLAYGILGDQNEFQSDPLSLNKMLQTNFVSAVLWMEQLASLFEAQGHGRLVVIGSVAGDRGRQSNYLYGATKGGLERVSEGMAHRFASKPDISVTVVKPGFIDTPMTDHLTKSGPLWATPDKVAESILKAVDKKRVRIYTPWFWRWILLIVRSLPVFVFHKTKM